MAPAFFVLGRHGSKTLAAFLEPWAAPKLFINSSLSVLNLYIMKREKFATTLNVFPAGTEFRFAAKVTRGGIFSFGISEPPLEV